MIEPKMAPKRIHYNAKKLSTIMQKIQSIVVSNDYFVHASPANMAYQNCHAILFKKNGAINESRQFFGLI